LRDSLKFITRWYMHHSDNHNPTPIPLLAALQQRRQQSYTGFHTPGHQRGRGSAAALLSHFGDGVWHYDLPELPGLDNLAAPMGVIAEAQALAAVTFGAEHTWFLVNGSTVGVMTAILATCGDGDVILLPRNVHQSAIAGVILAGAVPVLLTPDLDPETGLVYPLSPAAVADALSQYPQAKAVLVVSPTYEGLCADIAGLAAVTHAHHLPLLVDEAHGAHFHFHPDLPTAALDAGADVVVQSTHKVLGAATQAAMLHLQGHRVTPQQISRSLRLLQSSSPSYLLLASLDAARQQMATSGYAIYTDVLTKAAWVRQALANQPRLQVIGPAQVQGVCLDPTRLTVNVQGLGVSGYEVDHYLDQHCGLTAELPTPTHLTFILSLGTSQVDLETLVAACQQLEGAFPAQAEARPAPFTPALPSISSLAFSPRQAFFAEHQTVPLAEALGHISADWICPYPPGIPMLFPGEKISSTTLDDLQQAQQAGAELTGCSDPSLATLRVVFS
jgi:arginine decarboxylase